MLTNEFLSIAIQANDILAGIDRIQPVFEVSRRNLLKPKVIFGVEEVVELVQKFDVIIGDASDIDEFIPLFAENMDESLVPFNVLIFLFRLFTYRFDTVSEHVIESQSEETANAVQERAGIKLVVSAIGSRKDDGVVAVVFSDK